MVTGEMVGQLFREYLDKIARIYKLLSENKITEYEAEQASQDILNTLRVQIYGTPVVKKSASSLKVDAIIGQEAEEEIRVISRGIMRRDTNGWRANRQEFHIVCQVEYQQIETILSQIPLGAYTDLREIIKSGNSPNPDAVFKDADAPFKWEMIFVTVNYAHNWQTIRKLNGNYRWDEGSDLSDVALQVYKNGWIIRAFSATRIVAVYNPAAVSQIESHTNLLHKIEMEFNEYYTKLMLEYIESGTNEEFVAICQDSIRLAKAEDTMPVDTLTDVANRAGLNSYVILDELDRFEVTKASIMSQ